MRLFSLIFSIILILGTFVSSTEIPLKVDEKQSKSEVILEKFKHLNSKISQIWTQLTVTKSKNFKDICVWKICSRPLKKMSKTKNRILNEANYQNI